MRARPTVFIHIGAPKTGTTYLQNIMLQNQAALRDNGFLYPGDAVRSHFWASQDLREMSFHGFVEPRVAGAWGRLVDEIRPFDGSSIIDHEILAAATPQHIDKALDDLDFADVHIIWTARDIARQLPAAWQERVKNRDAMTFTEFLDHAYAGWTGTGPKRRVFWPMHSTPDVLARWSRNLPPERVHVVTVPPSGSDPTLLWRRFASVVGIDPDAYPSELADGNTSLTAAEAAVLRQLNAELADIEIPWTVYRSVVKHGMSGVLTNDADRTGRIELPADAYEWAVKWSHEAVQKVREAGYDVVGELADLIPDTRPTGLNPDAVPAEDQVAAATRMLRAQLELLAAQQAELEERGERSLLGAASMRVTRRGSQLARRIVSRRHRS